MAIDENNQERRAVLYGLLGDLPSRDRAIGSIVVSRESRSHYQLETLLLDLNGIEPVPAYFLTPLGSDGPWPVVVYNHAHGNEYELGKNEVLLGRGSLQDPPYGHVLTAAGYAVLCLDTWAFGERRGQTESDLFKAMLWRGQVLWGMMVYDSLRAIDYLAARADVNRDRIASVGQSMGSTMAWWTAALDPRVKVCIDICCMTDYEALIETRGLARHGVYYYVPSLLKHFTTAEINALIAPRAHLSLAGNYDPLTPPAGLARIDAALRGVYRAAGAAEAWQMRRYDVGHYETATMRSETVSFLARWL